VVAGPVAAEPSGGPYAGTMGQGGSATHHFTNQAPGTQCLAIYQPTLYTVRLQYAPVSDVLTLAVGAASDAGSNGVATLSFVANYCTSFDITVTGTEVADKAAYLVSVSSVRQSGLLCCGT
jgi:hypothetical protein